MSDRRTTSRGLVYKQVHRGKYECTRCGIKISSMVRWDHGVKHVCIPGLGSALSGYDPNASLFEQLEALSTIFADLAVRVAAEEREVQAENGGDVP